MGQEWWGKDKCIFWYIPVWMYGKCTWNYWGDISLLSFILAFIRFTNFYRIHTYADNVKYFVAGFHFLCVHFWGIQVKLCFLYSETCENTLVFCLVWEWLIKTIKSCVFKLIGHSIHNYFDLIITDVQNYINNKPLTYRSFSDPELDFITATSKH